MGVHKLYSSYFLYFLISLQKESMGEAEKLLGLIFVWSVLVRVSPYIWDLRVTGILMPLCPLVCSDDIMVYPWLVRLL